MNSEKMKQAEKNFGVKSIEQFDDIDVFILCISTHDPDDEYTPYVDGLFELARKISKDALEEDVHGVNQVRVIGGVSDCCLKTALQFYDRNNIALEFNDNTNNENTSGSAQTTTVDLGIPLHPVSEIEIAELTKIIENADRYLQIAFSEDLYLYCQANNVNFGELRDSLNTKWNVKILEPRDGVGGHCLPKDTKMFLQSSKSIKSKILMSAMEVDKEYRRFRELRGARLIPHAINSS